MSTGPLDSRERVLQLLLRRRHADLDPTEVRELENRLAGDPGLRAEGAELTRLLDDLRRARVEPRTAFQERLADRLAREARWTSLWSGVLGSEGRGSRSTRVLGRVAAVAAGILLGFVVSVVTSEHDPDPPRGEALEGLAPAAPISTLRGH